MVQRGRLQVRFSPPRPRGVQPGSGTCREHNGGGGGWGYRGLKGEQGASEAAQPAAAGLSVTCGCCGQVRRCYCAERAVLPAPDVGWTGGSGG